MLRIFALCMSIAAILAVDANGQTLSPKWEELTGPDFLTAIEKGRRRLPAAVRDRRETWAWRPTGNGPPQRPLFVNTGDKARVRDHFPGILLRTNLRSEASTGDDRLQHSPATGTPAGDGLRDGAKWMQEDSDYLRPWWKHQPYHFLPRPNWSHAKDYVVYALSGGGRAASMPEAARPSKPGVDGHAGEAEFPT